MNNLQRIKAVYDAITNSITLNGCNYELLDHAHISDDGKTYQAPVSIKGDATWVYWDIINPESEDGEDACSWDEAYLLEDSSRAAEA